MAIQTYPEVGDTLPSVALPDVHGRTVDLTAYRGRKLLLFMWASW